MLESKKVSVVIPVYNVSKYIKRCLDSVVRQTYKNIEIIIVDDGSTDDSGRIAEEYAILDDRIIVIHKENEGLGMARNTGIENATGDYIVFFDSDDSVKINMIQRLVEIMCENNAEYCKSGYYLLDKRGKEIRKVKYKNKFYENEIVSNELLPRVVGSSPNTKDALDTSVWSVMYNLELIKKNDIRFCSERKLIYEDMVFNLDYLKHVRRAYVSDEVFYMYYQNPGSLLLRYKRTRFRELLKLYYYIKRMLYKSNYNHEVYTRLDKTLLMWLKTCIIQEKRNISTSGIMEAVRNTKKMCSNRVIKSCIKEYPINKLDFKRQVFSILVKKRLAFLLLLLTPKE